MAESKATAPALWSGSFPFPHLGDWTQDGQPRAHGQSRTVSSVARSRRSSDRNPRSTMPAPPG